MSTITALAKRIKDANEAYRNGNPIMSDAAYDALEDQLRALDPNHPILAKVGAAAATKGWAKAAHSIPMGSLKKCQFSPGSGDGHGELRAWWPGKPAIGSHKLDGISCFDGETPIHLANGETMPIREIVEKGLKPQILSWTPEEGVVTRQVTRGFDNGNRSNWVELVFEDRGEDGVLHFSTTVVVTEDHKFYVPGEGWVAAKNLLGKNIRDANE